MINNSDGVAYDFFAELSSPSDGGSPICASIGALGPGKWQIDVKPPRVDMSMPTPAALDIYFTDQKGVSWRRHPNGVLEEEVAKHQMPVDGPVWKTLPMPLGRVSQ